MVIRTVKPVSASIAINIAFEPKTWHKRRMITLSFIVKEKMMLNKATKRVDLAILIASYIFNG